MKTLTHVLVVRRAGRSMVDLCSYMQHHAYKKKLSPAAAIFCNFSTEFGFSHDLPTTKFSFRPTASFYSSSRRGNILPVVTNRIFNFSNLNMSSSFLPSSSSLSRPSYHSCGCYLRTQDCRRMASLGKRSLAAGTTSTTSTLHCSSQRTVRVSRASDHQSP